MRVTKAGSPCTDQDQTVCKECLGNGAGEYVGVGEVEKGSFRPVKVDGQRLRRTRFRVADAGGLEHGLGKGRIGCVKPQPDHADYAVTAQDGFDVAGAGIPGEGGGRQCFLSVELMGDGQHHRRPVGHGRIQQRIVCSRFRKEKVKAHGARLFEAAQQFGVQMAGKGPGPVLLQAWFIDADDDDLLCRLSRAAQPEKQIQASVGSDLIQTAEAQQPQKQQSQNRGDQAKRQ